MDALRCVEVFHGSGRRVCAVERARLDAPRTHGPMRMFAALEPVAIVIFDAAGVQAIDTDAAPMELESLIDALPELRDRVVRWRAGDREA